MSYNESVIPGIDNDYTNHIFQDSSPLEHFVSVPLCVGLSYLTHHVLPRFFIPEIDHCWPLVHYGTII